MTALIFLLLAAATAEPQPFQDPFVDGTPRRGPSMIAVAPLTFAMGSLPDEPGYLEAQRRHRVELSGYAIAQYEVTNAEFCEFLNAAGNGTTRGMPWLGASPHASIETRANSFVPKPGAESRPVVAVTWEGARAYCAWLTRSTRFHYDLPTAAEWEAAARAGSGTTWPWGDRDEPGRYRGSAGETAPVGSYPPNAWGLHDMLGNAWEWVRDCYEHDAYDLSPVRDPVIARGDCLTPEVRGGSFKDDGRDCRPGSRADFFAMAAAGSIGFRVARYASVTSNGGKR
jgi:formylglycine-generating enzyme required for sulfatase activity